MNCFTRKTELIHALGGWITSWDLVLFLSSLVLVYFLPFLKQVFCHGGLLCFPGTSPSSGLLDLFLPPLEISAPHSSIIIVYEFGTSFPVQSPQWTISYLRRHPVYCVMCHVGVDILPFLLSSSHPFPPSHLLCPPRCYLKKKNEKKGGLHFSHLCFDINNCYW